MPWNAVKSRLVALPDKSFYSVCASVKEPGVEAQELQKSGQAVTLKVFDIPKGILH